MRIEAELKARVRSPERVRELLGRRASEELSVYYDTYFDTPDRQLTREGRELRARALQTGSVTTTMLTYKGTAVDVASGSKPEAETTVGDTDALRVILAGLGFEVLIAFEKHCSNYRIVADGRTVLATLVHVPELAGTYIEIESIVDTAAEVAGALDAIRAVLGQLGIERADETTQTYTDAVAARRA
ncbi:MAG: class IV adenylate cyclase [Pseudonocardiaceae bacterium]